MFGRHIGWPLGIMAGVIAVMGTPAQARDDKPLLPTLPCPVPAPVRVASAQTLAQFSGLLEDCTNLAVVVAPATTANRPSDDVVSLPAGGLDYDGTPDWPDNRDAAGVIIASQRGPRSERKANVGMPPVKVNRSADGSRVLIIPPVAPELPIVQDLGRADIDGDGQVEAILALRPRSYTTPFDQEIAAAARRHGVDPLLLHAVITQESRYRNTALSSAGARGLMQVMPQTGRGLGVGDARHLFDARTNIDAGARLLRQLWVRMGGRLDLVLAAYNAGEGAVRKYNMRVPPYRETQGYVVNVKAIYRKLAGESGIVALLD